MFSIEELSINQQRAFLKLFHNFIYYGNIRVTWLWLRINIFSFFIMLRTFTIQFRIIVNCTNIKQYISFFLPVIRCFVVYFFTFHETFNRNFVSFFRHIYRSFVIINHNKHMVGGRYLIHYFLRFCNCFQGFRIFLHWIKSSEHVVKYFHVFEGVFSIILFTNPQTFLKSVNGLFKILFHSVYICQIY